MTDRCGLCRLKDICLPGLLDESALQHLQKAITSDRVLERGQPLFAQDAAVSHCFVVRRGAMKTVFLAEDGEEHVTGFYLPGDIIGLDSLNAPHYTYSAIAMEPSTLCEIPGRQIDALMAAAPAFKRQIFDLMSQKIQETQHLSVMLRYYGAEQRVIALLLSLSSRFHRRRLSPTRFTLPVSRADIGNYLGLAVETVSRILNRLHQKRLITLQGRDITLPDLSALREQLHNTSRQPP